MKLTGSKILLECLLQEGVDTIFGYSGGAILPIYDAGEEEGDGADLIGVHGNQSGELVEACGSRDSNI